MSLIFLDLKIETRVFVYSSSLKITPLAGIKNTVNSDLEYILIAFVVLRTILRNAVCNDVDLYIELESILFVHIHTLDLSILNTTYSFVNTKK